MNKLKTLIFVLFISSICSLVNASDATPLDPTSEEKNRTANVAFAGDWQEVFSTKIGPVTHTHQNIS